jgi:putative heme iron utilization protein
VNGRPKDVLRETDAEAIRLARTLIRTARHGALAVLDPGSGNPLASRVAVATDHDGAPLILVSSLSAHTGGLEADARCSLLLGEPGKGDPLAHPRIALSCEAEKISRDDPRHDRVERRFLRRNPKSKLYAGFADFSFFRLEPLGASLNGGFGKAYALDRADLLIDGPSVEAVAAAEPGALSHMNDDHPDAVRRYARHFAGIMDDREWHMTGIDVDGFDLAGDDRVLRIFFAVPLSNAEDIHRTLVSMAAEARRAES